MSSSSYSPDPDQALNRGEGGMVDLADRAWPYIGEWPGDPTTAGYRPDEEPLAKTDNAFNSAVVNNIERVNYGLGELEGRVDDLEDDVDQLRSDLDALESAFQTHNHDSRYYRQYQVYTRSESDGRYVYSEQDDEMNGDYTLNGELNGSSGSVIVEQRTSDPADPKPGQIYQRTDLEP